MRRRDVLGMLGAGAVALTTTGFTWPRLLNECRPGHPPAALHRSDVLRAAWDGLDSGRVWDCHVHLLGMGDGGTGIEVHPELTDPVRPLRWLQSRFYRNAACVDNAEPVDTAYVDRLFELVDALPEGMRILLLAMDRFYDAAGRPDPDSTTIYVPNAYAKAVADRRPDRIGWLASVHPYRDDAVATLHDAAASGAVGVKWLPAAMGIDPASSRCDAFYETLASLDLPLLTHAGHERALPAEAGQEPGNPLRLRRPLNHGVRVVVAHCASAGDDVDLDEGPDGPEIASFELFKRLMDEPRYDGLLFGELSAVTQLFRAGEVLETLIGRQDWHSRLVNGSDYPLPGVPPLVWLQPMVEREWLAPEAAEDLDTLRHHNPLLFDLALKRSLRVNGHGFQPVVFESQRFFQRPNSEQADPRARPAVGSQAS